MQKAMRKIAVGTVMAGALALGWAVAGNAQAADPAVATWKLNVAKSTFSPGPAPKSMTLTITTAGKGLKVAIEAVGPDGAAAKWGYTTTGDDKDVPVAGNAARRAANVGPTPGRQTTYRKAARSFSPSPRPFADGDLNTVRRHDRRGRVQNVAVSTDSRAIEGPHGNRQAAAPP